MLPEEMEKYWHAANWLSFQGGLQQNTTRNYRKTRIREEGCYYCRPGVYRYAVNEHAHTESDDDDISYSDK
jgi:hypothetical protein